ncbi:hypothetical protein B0H16DRAFT_1621259 [Mycena metata]|uniref:MYND-type domain-containing protein n=1 Tax=Mycena metata TaxID=1033252 RepID=A0AAD7H6X6_9AGAR|nr:hypothetical protein B0H16DRAFT_1621259 [Mycena metata]
MSTTPLELQLTQFSLLPSLFQASAKDAADGSTRALMRICEIVSDCTDLPTLRLFLPVPYAVLQRAQMAPTDELNSEALSPTEDTLSSVYTALQILKLIRQIPAHIVLHMWPLMWKWIHFLMLYPSPLPYPAPLEDTICYSLAAVVFPLHSGHLSDSILYPADPAVCAVVEATVGVQLLFSRAWLSSLARGDIIRVYPTSFFIMRLRSTSLRLDEWIEGAGGTQWHLASFIVKLLDFLSPQLLQAEMPFRGAIIFIGMIIQEEELFLTLLKCGLFGALTRMLNALLTENIGYDIEFHLQLTLTILSHISRNMPMVERWIVEGLKARLLPALMSVAQRKEPYLTSNIVRALTSSLIHHSVAKQIDISVREVLPTIPIVAAPHKQDEVAKDLRLFLPHVLERLQVLSDYDNGNSISSQACDNMKCGIILPKSQLRRCSQCTKRYYCSETCQVLDWRDDGHRTVCKALKQSKLDFGSPTERGFMRAVLDSDFKRSRAKLFRRQVMHMYENPDTEFFCVYDFKVIPHSFGVYTLGKLPCTDPVWADFVARARRSGGRMEIHLMNVPDGTVDKVADGSSGRGKIFPLRSSRADIHVGLRAIAKRLPPGVAPVEKMQKQIDEEVSALLKATQDVVQIHCA